MPLFQPSTIPHTITNGNVAVNPGVNNFDFRVESASNPNMFVVDSTNNRVGIGTSSPSATFEVVGQVTISGNKPLLLASLTTAQRDALSATNGMLIYNSTDEKFQGYQDGAWVDLA